MQNSHAVSFHENDLFDRKNILKSTKNDFFQKVFQYLGMKGPMKYITKTILSISFLCKFA